MTKEDILKELAAVFADVFERTDLIITPDTSANDIEEWDSLNHLYLMTYIQKQFKAKFTAKEMQEFANVGEIVDAILTRTK